MLLDINHFFNSLGEGPQTPLPLGRYSIPPNPEKDTPPPQIMALTSEACNLSINLSQGTVLDRIDYNVEQSQVRVHEGYQQLQKADAYHRKNRKMKCILLLSAVTMLLTFILIVTKF